MNIHELSKQLETEARSYYNDKYWCNITDNAISVGYEEIHTVATRHNTNRTISGELPDISTHICIYCGIRTAKHYHHWNGYRNMDDVVPMCIECHNALHMKVKNDHYFLGGTKEAVLGIISTLGDMATYANIAIMLGTYKESVIAICHRHSIHKSVIKRNTVTPSYYEEIYTLRQKGLSMDKIACILGISTTTVWKRIHSDGYSTYVGEGIV